MPMVSVPVLPLLEQPDAAARCVDEALYGERLTVLTGIGPWRYVKTDYGYTGWTAAPLAREPEGRQQVVTARFCDILPAPDLKRPPVLTLPRGALVTPEGQVGAYFRLQGLGYVRQEALAPGGEGPLADRLIAAARDYLGTPYRWGGRSPWGIDCSGLCFMAARLCGVTLWRDALPLPGSPVTAIPAEQAAPGDLVYFPGHMALYTGQGAILHATLRRGRVEEELLEGREDLREKAAFYRISAS